MKKILSSLAVVAALVTMCAVMSSCGSDDSTVLVSGYTSEIRSTYIMSGTITGSNVPDDVKAEIEKTLYTESQNIYQSDAIAMFNDAVSESNGHFPKMKEGLQMISNACNCAVTLNYELKQKGSNLPLTSKRVTVFPKSL